MHPGVSALMLAACCTAACHADFTGYQAQYIHLGNGHIVMNIYAAFTNPADRVDWVYRTNISNTSAGGFFQSAANPFWKPDAQNCLTSDDSWVTIDTNPNGNGNSSASVAAPDPNFFNFDDLNGATDFSVIQGTGNGAGWYNSHPETQWGFANGPGTRVLLAHFVAANATEGITTGDHVIWNVRLSVTFAGQTGSTGNVGMGAENYDWIFPGPGAAGLLGVAGLFPRRRRPN